MRKFVVVIALLVLFGTTLAQSIALFNPLGNNEYVRSAEEGVRSIVEAAGGSVTAFDAGFDPAEQLNQMEDAISAGTFDAFIVYAVDGIGITVGVDDAAAAGIPVIAMDATINPDRTTLVPYANIAGQIARTGVGDGEQIGNAIVMACEGMESCEVFFMIGFEGFPLDLDRVRAIEGVLADHDGIQIVSVQAGGYSQEGGFTATTDQLLASPGIDVIAAVGDQMILGAELAVQDAGLEGQVKLIGNGASQDGYSAVVEGRWFATVANIPFTNGQIAAQMALQALDGSLIIRSVDMYDQSPPIPASGAVITQESATEFEPQW